MCSSPSLSDVCIYFIRASCLWWIVSIQLTPLTPQVAPQASWNDTSVCALYKRTDGSIQI